MSDWLTRDDGLSLIEGIAGWLSPSMKYRIGRDGSFIPFAWIDGERMLSRADCVNFATARKRMIQDRRAQKRALREQSTTVSA